MVKYNPLRIDMTSHFNETEKRTVYTYMYIICAAEVMSSKGTTLLSGEEVQWILILPYAIFFLGEGGGLQEKNITSIIFECVVLQKKNVKKKVFR